MIKNNWEAELGRLTFKAWKEGLWHSESALREDLKEFITKVLEEQMKNKKQVKINLDWFVNLKEHYERYEKSKDKLDLIKLLGYLSTVEFVINHLTSVPDNAVFMGGPTNQ